MQTKFARPESMKDAITHYCPGCGHGIVHRIICEVVDELDIREKLIGICPVGCSVVAYDYFDFDMVEVAHGRAPAVATGIKRALPDSVVFTYQGDGDLASIGMSEIIHAAARGEAFTVIFINNATYGMTGGQMAPTTLLGQRTATTPFGRRARVEGYPIKIPELLSSLPGAFYLERVAVNSPVNIKKTKKAIKKAFLVQIDKKKFSLVEVLSPCPTCWRLSPVESLKWMKEKMIPYYPLGVIKDRQIVDKNGW
ncbi:2-oxoglutarate oxidoreductase [Candidatus Aerophobetes bacterium]|uniref:2-oxoglutarate oxidoreductase n=1 Tax=Aerophobetes bacterium TaxID=2030807 RepID=A0A662DI58_UNCAE|nr:MAG: 2-oxoglutarate oxidoreductase [Candidatus Aerophobetes bacterium]